MKALYPAAWLMIILFLGWSGNLLLNIQEIWSEASELHKLSSNFDTLIETWRDLNRPGNDVLENYGRSSISPISANHCVCPGRPKSRFVKRKPRRPRGWPSWTRRSRTGWIISSSLTML
jgi:hypothetical protein